MILRNSTKGLIRKEVLHRRVWVWDCDEKQAQYWHIVVSRDPISKGQYKFSISNACAETSKQRLAYMQNQCFGTWKIVRVRLEWQTTKFVAGLDGTITWQ